MLRCAVESCEGGGKGFLIKHLCRSFPTRFHATTLDEHSANLQDYQNDPARWGLFTQLSILQAHFDALAWEPPPGAATEAHLIEGSPLSDRACHSPGAAMTEAERALYADAHDALSRQPGAPRIDCFVFLRCDPHHCYDRLLNSARREQAHVGLQTLLQQREAYDELARAAPAPVVFLDCAPFFEDNEPQLTDLTRKFLEALADLKKGGRG